MYPFCQTQGVGLQKALSVGLSVRFRCFLCMGGGEEGFGMIFLFLVFEIKIMKERTNEQVHYARCESRDSMYIMQYI